VAPVPALKGGPKVIEEIVLSIALPAISRVRPQALPVSMPMSQIGDVTTLQPVSQSGGETIAAVERGAHAETEGIPSSDGMTKELLSPGTRQEMNNAPGVPQQPQITVIRLEDVDMDAPARYDDVKMNLVNVPQPQVIIMENETQGETSDKKTPEDSKPQGAALPPLSAFPPNIQQIYSVDPQVIKRLQWRLARMEDFETSIGMAVQEIKEAIAKTETTRLELEEMRKGYTTVEKTMHELAALYDLISASVNPFIDSELEQQTISTKIMKRTFGMSDTEGAATTAPAQSFSPEFPKKKEEKHGVDYSVDTWTVKWAEFLLERIPKSKISALLDHYIEIGWLDEEIKARVEETIKGINEINLGIHVTEGEGAGEDEDERKKLDWWKLPIDDHVKSLQFIEKIRGGRGGGFTPPAEAKKP
jgi:archaellum component FlaD/FlaE